MDSPSSCVVAKANVGSTHSITLGSKSAGLPCAPLPRPGRGPYARGDDCAIVSAARISIPEPFLRLQPRPAGAKIGAARYRRGRIDISGGSSSCGFIFIGKGR